MTEPLTPRQIEILCLLAQGMKHKEIARELDITIKTVQTHLANISDRWQVSGCVQLVVLGIARGVVDVDEATKVITGERP